MGASSYIWRAESNPTHSQP